MATSDQKRTWEERKKRRVEMRRGDAMIRQENIKEEERDQGKV